MNEQNNSVIPDLIGDPSSAFENSGFPIELGMTGNDDEYDDDDEEYEKEWCD